jgi:hypothetical protein
MQIDSNGIPNRVFEDLLFRRRLERNLNQELERFNRLLKEQIFLIEQRRELLCGLPEPVANEEASAPGVGSAER